MFNSVSRLFKMAIKVFNVIINTENYLRRLNGLKL